MIPAQTSSSDASPRTRGGAGVLLAVGAVVTVGVLPVFLVGGLAVQIRTELGLSASLLGLAGSVFFGTSALVARPLATITERIGPTVAMRLASAGSAVCLAGLSAVPSTFWLLLVLCLAGIPTALSQPAANELLMARYPVHRQGFAFAVKQSAIPAATLLAGLAVPAIALTVGWRWVLLLAGLFGLLTVLLVPRLRWRPPNRRMWRRRLNRGARWQRPNRGDLSAVGSAGPVLLALAMVIGLGAAGANAMGTFVTVSAVDVGYAEAAAGWVLALGSTVGLTMRLVAGVVADRVRPDLLRMVAGMLGLGAVGYLFLAVGHPLIFLIGLVLGFGAGWAWAGVFTYAVAARFPDRVATATAATQTGVYVGAAGGPLLFGLIAEHAGLSAAWVTCAALTAVATMMLLVTRRRIR